MARGDSPCPKLFRWLPKDFFDAFFHLGPRHHHLTSAGKTTDSKIHSYPQNSEPVFSTGMRFFHQQDISHTHIHAIISQQTDWYYLDLYIQSPKASYLKPADLIVSRWRVKFHAHKIGQQSQIIIPEPPYNGKSFWNETDCFVRYYCRKTIPFATQTFF